MNRRLPLLISLVFACCYYNTLGFEGAFTSGRFARTGMKGVEDGQIQAATAYASGSKINSGRYGPSNFQNTQMGQTHARPTPPTLELFPLRPAGQGSAKQIPDTGIDLELSLSQNDRQAGKGKKRIADNSLEELNPLKRPIPPSAQNIMLKGQGPFHDGKQISDGASSTLTSAPGTGSGVQREYIPPQAPNQQLRPGQGKINPFPNTSFRPIAERPKNPALQPNPDFNKVTPELRDTGTSSAFKRVGSSRMKPLAQASTADLKGAAGLDQVDEPLIRNWDQLRTELRLAKEIGGSGRVPANSNGHTARIALVMQDKLVKSLAPFPKLMELQNEHNVLLPLAFTLSMRQLTNFHWDRIMILWNEFWKLQDAKVLNQVSENILLTRFSWIQQILGANVRPVAADVDAKRMVAAIQKSIILVKDLPIEDYSASMNAAKSFFEKQLPSLKKYSFDDIFRKLSRAKWDAQAIIDYYGQGFRNYHPVGSQKSHIVL